ncbi:hypothetical protein TRFO_30216 [Tritrichomonas foetus]|uniref:Uncharacterized protein n=1 Tax=Tritrichomonas foetus TaxID=1144522 RepID=A0A1J4JYF4_9EUKA|nr:hypothetical protein TRFO_30216 [Tritrichomonas foetus]|eukprot:OHT02564.1 hypothetical protein TRFO_30216 [Tritrichomonas foetus]
MLAAQTSSCSPKSCQSPTDEASEDIASLRESLLSTRNFDLFSTQQLLSIKRSLRQHKAELFASSSFIQARDLMDLEQELLTVISKRQEEEEKDRQKQLLSHPKLIEFDQKTNQELRKMNIRHESLMKKLEGVFDAKRDQISSQMVPSRALRDMKELLAANSDDEELREAVKELEYEEREFALINLEMEYQKAKEKLALKQEMEMKAYIEERKKDKRIIIASLKSNQTNLDSPNFFRKNMNGQIRSQKKSSTSQINYQNLSNVNQRSRSEASKKIPSLLSYARMAHKHAAISPDQNQKAFSLKTTPKRSQNISAMKVNRKGSTPKRVLPPLKEQSKGFQPFLTENPEYFDNLLESAYAPKARQKNEKVKSSPQ